MRELIKEIENAQRKVRTDAYQMSFGEVVTMYKESELVINPDFQRLFRWEVGQKARLIESLLLGIPIPSIFVFETEDGKWELVDGLQRVSTILEFMGLLKNPDDGQELPPSCLVATKYLPSLKNTVWQKSNRITDIHIEAQNELDKSLQIAIRRARLSVEILKKPSDNNTKYDLFQRLNAGGTQANPQELRNCVIIMANRNYYRVLKGLAEQPEFKEVIGATSDQLERQKHLEWACRFLVHNYVPYDGDLDIEEYINEGMMELASKEFSTEAEKRFNDTFRILHRNFGSDALRRIDNGSHSGRVGLVAFECIAIGIAKNIDLIQSLDNPDNFVIQKTTDFWKQEDIKNFLSQGMRGTTRIQKTVVFGERWFHP